MTCVLVTAITTSSEFKISHQEMIKGIAGYGYHDELIVPIIENTAWESELADSLERAILMYPKAYAVLVRDHGIYVWGDTWEQAKRHGECLHYLFNVAIQKHNMNITPVYAHLQPDCQTNGFHDNMELADDVNADRKRRRTEEGHSNYKTDLIHKSCDICNQKSANAHHYASGYKYIVFDIEGTTTPITFVKEVLFPYARDNFQSHVRNTWSDSSTQEDIHNLCNQAKDDLINFPQKDSLPTYLSHMIELGNNSSSFNEELLNYLTQYVHWCIDLDRKISALKLVQGKIWRNGYEANTLQSVVYPDVPHFFSKMKRLGAQIFIYSSGSMEAQRLLFKYSNFGDLRPFLSCYFDTSIGHKRQSQSYTHIFRAVGADKPQDILFVTDIIEEGYAAKEAGFNVILSNRPGNAPFPSNPPFPIVTTFDML